MYINFILKSVCHFWRFFISLIKVKPTVFFFSFSLWGLTGKKFNWRFLLFWEVKNAGTFNRYYLGIRTQYTDSIKIPKHTMLLPFISISAYFVLFFFHSNSLGKPFFYFNLNESIEGNLKKGRKLTQKITFFCFSTFQLQFKLNQN